MHGTAFIAQSSIQGNAGKRIPRSFFYATLMRNDGTTPNNPVNCLVQHLRRNPHLQPPTDLPDQIALLPPSQSGDPNFLFLYHFLVLLYQNYLPTYSNKVKHPTEQDNANLDVCLQSPASPKPWAWM